MAKTAKFVLTETGATLFNKKGDVLAQIDAVDAKDAKKKIKAIQKVAAEAVIEKQEA